MAGPTLMARTPFSGVLFPARATRAQEKCRDPRLLRFRIRAETMATEKLGIKVERNPPESRLAELGVRQWPKYAFFYGCLLVLLQVGLVYAVVLVVLVEISALEWKF